MRKLLRGSAMMSPTVMRGSSDEYGSWKIICRLRRIARSFSPRIELNSSPSNRTRPAVSGISWATSRPRVDLPQPDSPTNPRVSPRLIWNDTPSTAWTFWPNPAGKCLTTSSTSTSGASSITRLPLGYEVAGTRAGADIDQVGRAHLLVGPLHLHPAACLLAGGDLLQGRLFATALLDAEGAPGGEAASAR